MSNQCHIESNPYYDISLVADGDRVQHRVTGNVGTVEIYRGSIHKWDEGLAVIHGETFFTMKDFAPHIEVLYDDGTSGSVYPNQIIKVNANPLLEIAEKLDNCQSKEDLQNVKNLYGEDVVKKAWNEYLGDDLKERIKFICK